MALPDDDDHEQDTQTLLVLGAAGDLMERLLLPGLASLLAGGGAGDLLLAHAEGVAPPTGAPTFGGVGPDELCITTSREGLQPRDDPLAGALFRAMPGVRGLPARELRGVGEPLADPPRPARCSTPCAALCAPWTR